MAEKSSFEILVNLVSCNSVALFGEFPATRAPVAEIASRAEDELLEVVEAAVDKELHVVFDVTDNSLDWNGGMWIDKLICPVVVKKSIEFSILN